MSMRNGTRRLPRACLLVLRTRPKHLQLTRQVPFVLSNINQSNTISKGVTFFKEQIYASVKIRSIHQLKCSGCGK